MGYKAHPGDSHHGPRGSWHGATAAVSHRDQQASSIRNAKREATCSWTSRCPSSHPGGASRRTDAWTYVAQQETAAKGQRHRRDGWLKGGERKVISCYLTGKGRGKGSGTIEHNAKALFWESPQPPTLSLSLFLVKLPRDRKSQQPQRKRGSSWGVVQEEERDACVASILNLAFLPGAWGPSASRLTTTLQSRCN